MRLNIIRNLVGSLCWMMLFSLVTINLGVGNSGAAAASNMMEERLNYEGPTSVIKATYADAVLNGYGIEKRGPVYEDQDRLYDGDGYISFFFAENASSAEEAGNATFKVNATEAGLYKLSIGYYIPEGYGGKATGIQVNGTGAGELMLDAPAAGTVRAEKMVSKVLLNAGENTIKVTRGWGFYGIEFILLEPANAQAAGNLLEAEDGMMSGSVSIGAEGSGYSGEGYAAFQQSGSLTLNYKAPSAGMFDFHIGYSSPNGEKKTSIVLNGNVSEITLPETASFKEIPAGKAWMNKGDNVIEFLANWGWYNIDYIKLTAAATAERPEVSSTLINPNATPETRALMNYLDNQYGQKVISGQQTLEDAEWIFQQTGKYPAILATDVMDYSPSRAEKGATSTEVEKMFAWHKRGGIVSLCWHWNAPKGIGGEEAGHEWYKGFYTDYTTFDVEYALNHPDSEDYQLLLRDIDAIAFQLKRLQDAGVPLLWRPLHEAEGGWFWWGAKGPEPAKQLWRLMYDRMTNHHHLNNLIWVWNSEKTEWYPGDDIVDIASIDIYNPGGDYNPSIAKYESLVSLVNSRKVIGLAENGPIPDPEMLQAYNAHWSFFTTWTGSFIKDGTTNSPEHLKKVYTHDYVVTLDELPADLYASQKYEAEKGELSGLKVMDEADSYSGGGYISGADAEGGQLRIKADVAAGAYNLTIRYKTGNGQKKNSISINNNKAVEYTFEGTAEWTDMITGPYTLPKGEQTFEIITGQGGTDIDYIKLTRVTPSAENMTDSVTDSSGGIKKDGNTAKAQTQHIEVEGSELIFVLRQQINNSAESQVFVIKADKSEAKEIRIPASALKEAAAIAPNAVIRIEWDTNSYHFPVALINMDEVADRMGVKTADMKISIQIRKLNSGQAGESIMRPNDIGVLLDHEWFEFNVLAYSGTQSYEINHFGSRYVSHTFTISHPSGSGLTALRVDPHTGELSFVPALTQSENNTTVITIKRNGSGIYTIGELNRTFDDLSGHWAKRDIEFMANHLLVHGIDDRYFAPDQLMTRAEFTVLMARALGLSASSRSTVEFSDVSLHKWYAGPIAAASEAGLVTGYSDGTFRPDAWITREQMAVLIVRAVMFTGNSIEVAKDAPAPFPDTASVSHWAKDSVDKALSSGLVQGVNPDQFAAKDWADRAQAAVMVKRLLIYLNFINA
ncbi:glycosyl hydrolase [Paenibacillus sp. FSL K6-1217]|uniref:glycosyl hydrolase n=1 Tax=Paenibacillus sp. FSL K6-1217 TaxID=2921466 RepID=UPI00386FF4D2